MTRHKSAVKGERRIEDHPDLIGEVRAALLEIGAPFVIENVIGARAELQSPLMLCGSMFGLGATFEGAWYGLRRHRLFELHGATTGAPRDCAHRGRALPVYGHAGGSSKRDGLRFPGIAAWREGMGIDCMASGELAEAIPPAFTEHVGRAFLGATPAADRQLGMFEL